MFANLLTKYRTKIPLFWVDFNYREYKKFGKPNSCDAHLHPLLRNDEYIDQTLRNLIDYIRKEFDMEEI